TPHVDGASLLPLLQQDVGGGPSPPWRSDFLIEHLRETNPIPTYCATRSETSLYLAYQTGEQELYARRPDPAERTNLASDPADRALLDARRARLEELCSPTPPGFAFVDTGRRTAAGVGVLGVILGVAAVAERRRSRRRRV